MKCYCLALLANLDSASILSTLFLVLVLCDWFLVLYKVSLKTANRLTENSILSRINLRAENASILVFTR